MELDDKQTSKRTDRKSEGIRKASRVVDMSWAADYLDDTWENEHAVKGAYDTQVLPPLKKYMQAEVAGVNPFSSTQEFKAVPGEEPADDIHFVDAETGRTIASKEEAQEVRNAVRKAQPEDCAGEDDDDLKIRDAVTDQTVASVEEARAVRKAAAFFDLREDLEERPLIRDAIFAADASDGMEKVRQALASVPKTPAFMSRTSGTFTASSTSTGSPYRTEPKSQTSQAGQSGQTVPIAQKNQTSSAERLFQNEPARPVKQDKPREQQGKPQEEQQEEQAKTIVASKDVMNVRKAASDADASRFHVEKLFRNDEIDLEPDEDDLYDQYEDVMDYEDPDDYDDRDRYGDYGDVDDRDRYDDFDDADDFDDYDEYERRKKPRRRLSKYYYGYKQPRNPLRFIPLVLVVAICVLGFIVAMQICHDVPLNASDYSKVKYTVEAGLSDEKLSQDLQALGIIDNPLVFRLRCKFYSADYVPGTYELSPCYSTEKIINILSGYTYGADD